jgi:hypothetical protein
VPHQKDKEGIMRQDNHSSNRDNQARPADRANTLAGRLSAVHHADLVKGATILAEFAGSNMQDPAFSKGHETNSEAEELAYTVLAVLRSDPKEFDGILPEYMRLLGLVRAFLIGQGGNALAIAQLDRIETALASTFHGEHGTTAAVDVPRVRRWLMDKAVIAAAILLALFVWNATSGHCETWRLLAAIALVAGVCPLMLRIGAKHASLQTPVKTKP